MSQFDPKYLGLTGPHEQPAVGLMLRAELQHALRMVPKPKPKPTPSVRDIVYERDGYKCLRCGSRSKLTLDEVVPRALGGRRCIENCQTLCEPCNIAKGATVVDYREAVA